MSFDSRALDLAVESAAGYPYMMQLVGWHLCEPALERDDNTVTYQDVAEGLPGARQRLKQSVLARIGYSLSPVDRRFLAAMAMDEGPSTVKAVQQRMGKSRQYVDEYRVRLLGTGLISQVKRGVYDFVIPGHRSEVRGSEEYQAFQARKAEWVERVNKRH